jgi:hypothetical protein
MATSTSKKVSVCPAGVQAHYLRGVAERNQQEKSQFKEVVQHYMDAVRALKVLQDHARTLERENYALKQTKG